MSNSKDDYYEYSMYHNIADFADLSITEIIALQFLVRYSDPVVRHTLYTEVKQFIEFKEMIPDTKINLEHSLYSRNFYKFINSKKQLSTSSFYHSLSKLKDIGLISADGETGKVAVRPTPFTNFVPKLLLKFLINNNIMDSPEYREEFSKKFLEKIGNIQFERVLSIWFSEYVPLSVATQISKYTNELYILSKNESNGSKNKNGQENFRYSEIIDGLFRDRDDFFDGAFVPVYKQKPKFYEMSKIEILKEISRVVKKDGYIVLVAVADLNETKNIFINELIKLYKSALNNRMFTKEELNDDMTKAGFNNIDIFEHQGLLIGIGKNPLNKKKMKSKS